MIYYQRNFLRNVKYKIRITILLSYLLLLNLFILKNKVLYYINNWVYSTNHRRISVNYFWFIILAGIVGMVLATLIRLELAYPGVGIFAGDSLQYLSMTTAHGVIMVFFMIMPLLFGAFGNFLLPTQLGVHDVAFPRLNSAAFWFLPGGLIMLAQLVCIDRRYQRMNCFNMREVQALLKKRFFAELVDDHLFNQLLNKNTLILKYKTNDLNFLFNHKNLFLKNGIYSSTYSSQILFFLKNKIQKPLLRFLNDKFEIFNNLAFMHIFVVLSNISELLKLIYKIITFIFKLIFFIILLNLKLMLLPIFFFFINFKVFFDIIWYILFASIWRKNQNPNLLSEARLDLICEYFFLYNQSLKVKVMQRDYSNLYTQKYNFYKLDNRNFLKFVFHIFFGIYFLFKFFLFLAKEFYYEYFSFFYFSYNNFWTFFNFKLVFLNFFKLNWSIFYNSNKYYFFKFKEISYLCLSGSFRKIYWEEWFELSNVKNRVSALDLNLIILKLLWKSFINFFLINLIYLYEIFNKMPLVFYILFYINILKSFINIKLKLIYDIKDDSVIFNFFSLPTNFRNENIIFANKNIENSSIFKFQKNQYPTFKYDYKAGNYFSKNMRELFYHLIASSSALSNSFKTPVWYFSMTFSDSFREDTILFGKIFFEFLNNKDYQIQNFKLNPLYSYFFIFNKTFKNTEIFQNFQTIRWNSVSSLNQKFYRMFETSTMQQRIFVNWQNLKFSREAWRCKMLVARFQKTLYKRYIHENSLFWSIERNAKDLLPGWAMITPFSSRVRFTSIGKVDIGLMGVLLVLNASIISSANFLVTYRYLSTLNNRKMRDARAFFTEGLLVASWMMVAANPMLIIGIFMLLSDRHWQTSFFDYSGGGDTIMFQHMFWFFGHPEVYIIIIPTFGFTNTIMSYYLKKRVSARASLLYSMYTIAFLGFFVWGHHMYMVGLAHTTRMLFSTLTVMISVPAATKLMHWCVTLTNSFFNVEIPFLFILLFIFFFVSGGISGMCVAHTGMDILFHDTFYVIGHFHVMLAGAAMFGSFGAFYFYFVAIFGVKYSRIFAYLHFSYYLLGQLMTVIPMFWLGYAGMPRRVLDYPASMGGWHSIISAGHLVSTAGIIAFFIMIFDSLRQKKAAMRYTFGVSRVNTRVSFYIFAFARFYYNWKKNKYNLPFLNLFNFKKKFYNFEKFELVQLKYKI